MTIIEQELPLNVAQIILCCLLLMLYSDFKAGVRSIPTPPMATFPGRSRDKYPAITGIMVLFFLVHHGNVLVLSCIYCLHCARLVHTNGLGVRGSIVD